MTLRPIPALAALLALAPGPARADSDTHYQDFPIGERASGMGGAFTALANEGTGAYYNPAGIISDHYTVISGSAGAYSIRVRRVEMGDLCGTVVEDDQSYIFSSPASFGLTQQIHGGRIQHALGLTIAIPHMSKVNQALAFARDRVSGEDRRVVCGPYRLGVGGAQVRVDRVFSGGLTYAVRPWRWVQLGLTVGVGLRYNTQTSMATLTLSGAQPAPNPVVEFANGDALQVSLFLQAGVLLLPTDRLRLGISLTSPHIRLFGSGRYDLALGSGQPGDTGGTFLQPLEGVDFFWKVPFKLAVGAAYTFKPGHTLALDVSIHGHVPRHDVVAHPQLAAAGVAVPQNQRVPVVNFNLGSEFILHRYWALRSGLYTNFTSVPASDDRYHRDRVDRFGLALGVTSFYFGHDSSVSLVLQGQLGVGETLASLLSYEDGQLKRADAPGGVTDFALIINAGGSVGLF